MARRGKYEGVVDGMQRVPPADVGYQARVDEMKEALKADVGNDPVLIAKFYVGLRAEKERVEAALKAVNLRIEAATQMLVASQDRGDEAWGKYGVKDNALRLEDGSTIRVRSEPYGQVKDKEAFRLWCIDNGYASQLQLWPTTMNAIVKERALNGDPYPDGCEAFRKDILVFSPAGSKDD